MLAPDAAASAAAGDADGALRATATEPSGRGRTMDLLIDLQPRSAGLEFSDRARALDKSVKATPGIADRPAPSAAPPAPVAPPGGLFGVGATPTVMSRRVPTHSDIDWRGSADSGGTAATSGSSTAAAGPQSAYGQALEIPRWLLLIRDLIQYVRDHRDMVIVSAITLLVLLWGGSIAFTRKRS